MVACQEKEEALLADGDERLSQLRATHSSCPRHHGRDAMDAARCRRIATASFVLLFVSPVDATAKDDDVMGLDGSSVMTSLINDAHAKRPRLALCGGGESIMNSGAIVSLTARSPRG